MVRYKHIDTHHWVRQFRQYGHTVKLITDKKGQLQLAREF